MEGNTMEDGEINDVAGEEVVTEGIDYAKVKNKVMKPRNWFAGETGPELSSDYELRAQFCTARSLKTKKSSKDGVKQSSIKNQNINESQCHNRAKEGVEQVESEAQSLGTGVTNKFGDGYGQTSHNRREALAESF
jgi:hypothetical protein